MLWTSAPVAELSRLRSTLQRLWSERPQDFATLFDPLAEHGVVELDAAARDVLQLFALVELDGALAASGHRIRRVGSRWYVLELGTREYRQDIWPETDAMLAELDAARPGRLLDMGTGTGVVAVEAALRGHEVVATDLYESALELAYFNARLNGVEAIEFRQGHLFEPVAGETFDLILTAPHYTRVADQLRVEALRTGAAHVAAGGKLVVATFLEWEGDGPLALVESVLRPLVAAGRSVTVRPMPSTVKREWFYAARAREPLPGLVSRHRFLVEIEAGGGQLRVERPEAAAMLAYDFVPLKRLRVGAGGDAAAPAQAVVDAAEDVARLGELAAELARGLVTLSGAIPQQLLDACRFGARACVSMRDGTGAAGAIADGGGGVRPCTRGAVLGRVEDTQATILATERRLWEEARARRGCDGCSAVAVCSRCLYPAPFADEAAYCDWVRAHAAALPALTRLFEVLGYVSRAGAGAGAGAPRRVRVKTGRTAALVAARGRPWPSAGGDDAREQAVRALAARWRERETWIAAVDEQQWVLLTRRDGVHRGAMVSRTTAALGELIADGATGRELEGYARSQMLDGDTFAAALAALEQQLM